MTDSPTKHFMRLHAEHLHSIGMPEVTHGGQQTHERFNANMSAVNPSHGEAVALGSSDGFEAMSTFFSEGLF